MAGRQDNVLEVLGRVDSSIKPLRDLAITVQDAALTIGFQIEPYVKRAYAAIVDDAAASIYSRIHPMLWGEE